MVNPDDVLRLAEALPERDYQVIDLSHGLTGGCHSIREIAAILKITRNRAQRSYDSAFRRLKLALMDEQISNIDIIDALFAGMIRRRAGLAPGTSKPALPSPDDHALKGDSPA